MAARVLAPLLRLSQSQKLFQQVWRRAGRVPLNTRYETALSVVINVMTKARVLFQPRIVVHGEAALDAALRRERGVLLVAPHAHLSSLALRYLHDRGIAYYAVAADDLNVTGTDVPARILTKSPGLLFKARRILAAHSVLVAMIDRSSAQESRATEFHTPGGALRISSALLELAHRFDVSIVFFMAKAGEDRNIALRFQAPSAAANSEVASIVTEFANFCLQGVGIDVKNNIYSVSAITSLGN